ncbi:MAG: hypothetical protein AAF652_11905, partial [Cyanobacteria bacterium P01_C01_bin.72]
MYRTKTTSEEKAEDFKLSDGDGLSSENRWIKLAKLIPWSELARYMRQTMRLCLRLSANGAFAPALRSNFEGE